MTAAPANFNAAWARAIAQELARGGVREVAVSPGSRSAPLALACAAEPGLRVHVVIDERSAAFVALGAAKATGAPAAALATSGTAGAHFFPALLEAEASGVPLVLLTADRPHELHGFGAPQTIDQQALFGRHAGFFADLGAPDPTDAALLQLRAVVARAVAAARGRRPGPVHLNAPFREPLAPTPAPLPAGLSSRALEGARCTDALGEARGGDAFEPFLFFAPEQVTPHPAALDRVAAALAARPRGVIVCGPRDPTSQGGSHDPDSHGGSRDPLAAAVAALSTATGYPVLAEATSNLRASVPDAIATYDTFLRHAGVAAALEPEAVIRLGGGLTSKVLQTWLDGSGALTVLLAEGDRAIDPNHAASALLAGDISITCTALADRVRALGPASALPPDRVRGAARPPAEIASPARRSLVATFSAAEASVRSSFEAAFAGAGDSSITEPRLAREVAAALPDDALLFVSSSMPIRDLDAFAPALPEALILANRGANGIDGITSTALGAAIATGKRTAVLLGDVALLHDLSGLIAARRLGASLTLIVPNNDGGGIFHFLPIAAQAEAGTFEALFGTPHGIDLATVAALAGATLHRPQTPAALRSAVRESLGFGLHLIEVKTDRHENVGAHRDLQARALTDLEARSWS